MKAVKFFTLAFALLISVSVFAQDSKMLPSVELKTLEGKTVNLQELGQQGHPVLISFWATWCSPCKKELDAVADYYEDWQKDYNLEIVAITIDNQRALAKVKPMVQTKGWEYTILSDANGACQQAMNFQSVPQTFLLNAAGEIVWSHTGYVPGDEEELEEQIELAVKGK